MSRDNDRSGGMDRTYVLFVIVATIAVVAFFLWNNKEILNSLGIRTKAAKVVSLTPVKTSDRDTLHQHAKESSADKKAPVDKSESAAVNPVKPIKPDTTTKATAAVKRATSEKPPVEKAISKSPDDKLTSATSAKACSIDIPAVWCRVEGGKLTLSVGARAFCNSESVGKDVSFKSDILSQIVMKIVSSKRIDELNKEQLGAALKAEFAHVIPSGIDSVGFYKFSRPEQER